MSDTTEDIKAMYGRRGYEAYASFTGGKTFDGRDMPKWEELPERIQKAWAHATDEAIDLWVDYNI